MSRKTQTERQIVMVNAWLGESKEYCNERLKEAGFDEVNDSSWKMWTRGKTGYLSKLDSKEKIRNHMRKPSSLGDL